MKPWFEKEAEIIPFPKKPERQVIKMPSVSEYPDFITGVLDLQARRDKGQISKDSYNRLYQDLIHRFMKKESFEKPWFLREAPTTELLQMIKDKLNDPSLDDKVLQKVLMALEGGGLKQRVQGVLENDPDAKKVLASVTEQIFSAKPTTEDIEAFITAYPKGLVNIQALLEPGKKEWSQIFVGYQPDNHMGRVVERLYKLKNQGIGPAEVCLSVLSPKIFHSGSRPGAGDIFIDGAGHFEIKASVAKPGRLFDGRKAKVDMNTIQNVRDQLKIEKPRVNLKDLIGANPTQEQVVALTKAIFRHVGDNVGGFVNAIMKKDEASAKVEHTKMAYMNYQNMSSAGDDKFVGIIFMSLGGKWSNIVRNIDELVQNLAVGTIYVASPDQADLFPQTTFKF
tara:strand:- start:25 stop:1209 length:1185 start_codon:yes stop_codon:yes gene_type:complete